MPFDWRNLLPLAEELAGRRGDEAACRSAVGRAYYAAMGRAAEMLPSEGVSISFLKTHADTWQALRRSADGRRVAAGKELNDLRHMRNRADYDASTPADSARLARDAVELARFILAALDDAPPWR